MVNICKLFAPSKLPRGGKSLQCQEPCGYIWAVQLHIKIYPGCALYIKIIQMYAMVSSNMWGTRLPVPFIEICLWQDWEAVTN